MADHEGGRISVLARAIGAPPSQMAIGRSGGKILIPRIMGRTVRLMKKCGINLTLSPVADVNSERLNPVIGTRSFGEDPESVSGAVRIAVLTIAAEGMLSCLKHFPGHGAAAFDSHLTLPVIGKTVDELQMVEFPPFIAGIEEGADTVMTAHVALSEGDPPASLDRRIVTDLLREKLGFEGVVITDALEMAGALPDRKAMSSIDPGVGTDKSAGAVPAAVIWRALEAGNDLLLMSRPIGEVYDEIADNEAALSDIFQDEASAERIERSVARITTLRNSVDTASPKTSGDGMDNGNEPLSNFAVFSIPPGREYGFPREIRPVFTGWKRDFDDYVVRRFISRVFEGLDRAGLHPGPVPDLDRPEPVRLDNGSESGLYTLGPAGWTDSGKVMFLLCRRPPPEEIIRNAASGCEAVVVAERPWDADMLPDHIPLVITYGIYDSAADQVVDVLSGSGWRGPGDDPTPQKLD
jgi:beta-glucosidase-like glycosyl hydrolase